jgi:hypothetical protein
MRCIWVTIGIFLATFPIYDVFYVAHGIYTKIQEAEFSNFKHRFVLYRTVPKCRVNVLQQRTNRSAVLAMSVALYALYFSVLAGPTNFCCQRVWQIFTVCLRKCRIARDPRRAAIGWYVLPCDLFFPHTVVCTMHTFCINTLSPRDIWKCRYAHAFFQFSSFWLNP